MTWTPAHAEWWKSVLESPNGKTLLEKLRKMRPTPACEPVEHQPIYRLGAIAGHEQCQTDLVNLSVITLPKPQPEANYGVKTPKAENKVAPT